MKNDVIYRIYAISYTARILFNECSNKIRNAEAHYQPYYIQKLTNTFKRRLFINKATKHDPCFNVFINISIKTASMLYLHKSYTSTRALQHVKPTSQIIVSQISRVSTPRLGNYYYHQKTNITIADLTILYCMSWDFTPENLCALNYQ